MNNTLKERTDIKIILDDLMFFERQLRRTFYGQTKLLNKYDIAYPYANIRQDMLKIIRGLNTRIKEEEYENI